MASPDSKQYPLPKDLVELQLGQINLLMAMYAPDNAIGVRDDSLALLEALRSWNDNEATVAAPLGNVCLFLTLRLQMDNRTGIAHTLQLNMDVPFSTHAWPLEDLTEPPKVAIKVAQPEWMSKADTAKLNREIPDEDVLSMIEHIQDQARSRLNELTRGGIELSKNQANPVDPLVRAWFYFPSISTRSKRDDLIKNAPRYSLTGFLLAGKPGVMCLEGGTVAIDDYMKFIKTESWGDIPAHHKKVSERYRETGTNVRRAFLEMQEITDLLGDKRGERANRNDMKALESWLGHHGLEKAFTRVFL